MSDKTKRSSTPNKRQKKKLKFFIDVDRFITSLAYKIENVPVLGPLLFKLWRVLRSFARTLYIALTKFRISRKKQPYELKGDAITSSVDVTPKDIIYVTKTKYLNGKGKGSIIGGNWDQLDERFEDKEVFIALKQVIMGQKDWEDTEYYQKTTAKLINGESLLGFTNEKEFNAHCNKFLNFAQKTDAAEDESKQELFQQEYGGKIDINIGRYGHLLFYRGEHALALAKILGLDTIPVNIIFRHSQWMKFRKRYEILALGRGTKAYQPSLHPDLNHIPAQQGSVERFKLIKANLSTQSGRLLDLGANLGYFCIQFEDQGFDCVAVENSPRFAYCLKGLKRSLNRDFKIITESLLDSQDIIREPFDVVLALNIFHHLLKRKETFLKLENFLKNLKCKEMYFEPHLFDDPQMSQSYINMQEYEFAEFVRSMVGLSQAGLIGRASDNRPIYKIS